MVNYGKKFEEKLINLLALEKIPFTKENTQRRYGGGKIGKGKFDFEIGNKMCLECKSIGTGSNLRLPWPKAKNTPVKTHQLRELRREMLNGKFAGLLIEINSALVSAQNRKRLYWTNIQGVTLPKDKGILLKDILLDDAIIPVVHNIYGGFGEKSPRIFPDKSPTIRTAAGGGHIPSVVMGEAWHKWWEQNKQYQLDKKYSSLDADKAITMLARQYASWTGNFVTWKEFIRKLHPIECERLQTLPDNYTDGISNSQRYKCLGNGWTVGVIAHILSFIQEPYLHTVVSLFDGVSCGQVALKRAGKAYNQYYASEIDKYAMKVAMKNYPHTMQLGNVVGINWTSFTGRLNMIQRVS